MLVRIIGRFFALLGMKQHDFLVGGLEPWNFMTFHILGIMIPTDFHIFQRGRYTTKQFSKWRMTERFFGTDVSWSFSILPLRIRAVSDPQFEYQDWSSPAVILVVT